jgi:CRP-like cAMP-binding protein
MLLLPLSRPHNFLGLTHYNITGEESLDKLYIIVSGSVLVHVGSGDVVVYQSGDIIGDAAAFFEHLPLHSATQTQAQIQTEMCGGSDLMRGNNEFTSLAPAETDSPSLASGKSDQEVSSEEKRHEKKQTETGVQALEDTVLYILTRETFMAAVEKAMGVRKELKLGEIKIIADFICEKDLRAVDKMKQVLDFTKGVMEEFRMQHCLDYDRLIVVHYYLLMQFFINCCTLLFIDAMFH